MGFNLRRVKERVQHEALVSEEGLRAQVPRHPQDEDNVQPFPQYLHEIRSGQHTAGHSVNLLQPRRFRDIPSVETEGLARGGADGP